MTAPTTPDRGRAPDRGALTGHLPAGPATTAVGSGPGACAACGRARDPGELLRVIDRWGLLSGATICRPSVSGACLAWAGTTYRTSIELLDAGAAREHDRALGGEDPMRRAEAHARAHARARSDAARGGAYG